MMAGDLPFHIRGSAQWPLLYFARDAAEQCDHPPRSVQILMTSMQGLPEPQVVVTSADLPPDVTVVPVDMRPYGHVCFSGAACTRDEHAGHPVRCGGLFS